VKVPAKKTGSSAKPAVKAKAAVKPAPKKAAKPVASKKAAVKTPSRAPVKTPVKARPAPVKTGAAGKTLKPAAKGPVKAAPKMPPAKSAAATKSAKPVPKPAAVAPVKASHPVKDAAKPAAKPVPPVAAPAAAAVSRPPERSMLIPAPPALKPGRRSSARALSQMPPPAPMVPTHAPDAAKASYSTMTERVIAPPPHVAAKKDPKLADNWKSKAAEQLTDEEVKAMPDTEYMNEKQMAFFRHKLSILKQEIHNSAGETTEHLREDTVVVPDPADRATIEEEHALELRTRDRERKLLKKIEQSIARIDSGDYGYCDETGEPIGVGRLIARPTANLSLEAQQRRELKQKMFGD
jgi:DnaK suppressor protein